MLFVFFLLPPLVVSPGDLKVRVPAARGLAKPTAPTAVDLVQARNGVRTAAVALLAGVGAVLAAGFAGRTYYMSRRAQLSDRIRAAADRWGVDAPLIQMAAIGELARLAKESPAHHAEIMGILTAFLKDQKRPDNADDPPTVVQAAFAALAGRRKRYDQGWVLDLAGADLRRVRFEHARLGGANLRDARLDGAFLQHGDLRKAHLEDAEVRSVRLDHAKLNGAFLDGAKLKAATLDSADARGASFCEAEMEDAFLRSTDLRNALGLPIQNGEVAGAHTDEETKLPKAA